MAVKSTIGDVDDEKAPPSVFAIILDDGGIVIAERVAFVPGISADGEAGLADALREFVHKLAAGGSLTAIPFNASLDKGGFGLVLEGAAARSEPSAAAAALSNSDD